MAKGRSVAVGVGEDLAVAEHRDGTVVADGNDGGAGVVVAVSPREVWRVPLSGSTVSSALLLGTSRTPSRRRTPSASNTAAPSTWASASVLRGRVARTGQFGAPSPMT